MATEGTAFGAVLRRLRLAAGLTQERLAERAGVSAKAIVALENDPARTPRLKTVTRLADALGLDRDDRASLLAAARPTNLAVAALESLPLPRPGPIAPSTSFRGESVGQGLASADLEPTSLEERAEEPEPIPRSPLVPPAHRGEDWGEAPDVGELHGRAPELATLGRWVGADGCRLLAVVGMGGVGKTADKIQEALRRAAAG
jgi:transcriptional regulator with XRE-family HTH domain